VVNLDTHVLVHALAGRPTARERRILSREPWGVCAIVFWEIAKLVQLGRIDLDLDDPEVTRAFSGLHVWQVDVPVARASTRLDFRGDPADELIAATSLVHGVPLLTRDRVIRRSRLVPFA
jgi:PIN domain nuclease of toxin-antitoxin system